MKFLEKMYDFRDRGVGLTRNNPTKKSPKSASVTLSGDFSINMCMYRRYGVKYSITSLILGFIRKMMLQCYKIRKSLDLMRFSVCNKRGNNGVTLLPLRRNTFELVTVFVTTLYIGLFCSAVLFQFRQTCNRSKQG